LTTAQIQFPCGLLALAEDAALCLETIPKRISALDRFSSKWNQQAYRRRASGIRDLKKWVLLPKPETRDYLERELLRVLLLAAIGDWDGLPQADLPQDAPVPFWRRTLMLIRSIVIGAIPLVLVTVFGNKLPEDFRKYLVGFASIWAVVHLLAGIDPRFGEKLSALKDLPSFLPFGGKSTEPK
jgi:hypothetical protein